jgi:hypothetical protein
VNRRRTYSFGLWLLFFFVCFVAVGANALKAITDDFTTPADIAAWQVDHPEDWEIAKEGDLDIST